MYSSSSSSEDYEYGGLAVRMQLAESSSSSSSSSSEEDEDEEYRQAFGRDASTRRRRKKILAIRKNYHHITDLSCLGYRPFQNLTDSACELLGRYISNNTHLKEIDLGDGEATANINQLSALFRGLTKSSSVETLNLDIMLGVIQVMVPFLGNSSKLTEITLAGNRNINTEGFELLVNALNEGPIQHLNLHRCNIEDISALENCTLPHLRELHLNDNNIRNVGSASSLQRYTSLERLYLKSNNIGRDGCLAIAYLLQKENSSLFNLYLEDNKINDEEMLIITNSLRRNTTLKRLYLEGNTIGVRGVQAFLMLLNDVTSIESTFKSNHTLLYLDLPKIIDQSSSSTIGGINRQQFITSKTFVGPKLGYAFRTSAEFGTGYHRDDQIGLSQWRGKIDWAVCLNNNHKHNSGREKVIQTQLNSTTRKLLALLQGIDRTHNCLLLSEIDNALILPELLSLVGNRHGHSELYELLIAAVPDLASIVNRAAVLKQTMEEKKAKAALLYSQADALTAEIMKMNDELQSIEISQSRKSNDMLTANDDGAEDTKGKRTEKKRRRG